MHSARYILSVILLGFMLAGRGAAADGPASRPSRNWGPVKAGLALSAEVIGDVRRGSPAVLSVALRNSGGIAGGLCDRKDAVAWLILKTAPANGTVGKYYFSGRVFPGSMKGSARWPESLASGRQFELGAMDFGDVALHPYSKGVKFLSHHLTGKGDIPAAEGKLRDVLVVGKVSMQYMLYLQRKDDAPVVLKSAFVTLDIGPPDLKKLSASARKAFVDELIAGFYGDPFAGRNSHGLAVRLGGDILDDLLAAAKNPKVKGGGRMWLVTALADIRDKRSASMLVKLIDEPGSVGHVVAYHGPKQRDAALDEVIIARASKSKDPRMAALAMLGFMVFRGKAPGRLLDAGVNSDDPRVRSTVVAALSKTASIENVRGLVLLMKDTEPRIRSAVARALGAMGNRQAFVIGGLIGALDLQGDRALIDVCDALGKLTGRVAPYDSAASADKKRGVLAGWRQWWIAARKNHR